MVTATVARREAGSILSEHECINRALSRFIRQVEERDGHWLWRAARFKPSGKYGGEYGYFYFRGRMVYAHRFAYEAFVGPIPDGLTIDHLCRQTLCANPDHLEAVPHIVNIQRGLSQRHTPVQGSKAGTCKHGHLWSLENSYIDIRGHFRCRQCQAERMRRVRARRTSDSDILSAREPVEAA